MAILSDAVPVIQIGDSSLSEEEDKNNSVLQSPSALKDDGQTLKSTESSEGEFAVVRVFTYIYTAVSLIAHISCQRIALLWAITLPSFVLR